VKVTDILLFSLPVQVIFADYENNLLTGIQ
jgi:hypothetical protein